MSSELPTSTRRLPTLWQNPSNQLDVDDDDFVTPSDVRLVVNILNANQFTATNGQLPNAVPEGLTRRFYDTDGNGFATHLDALRIVNFLNLGQAERGDSDADAEGDAAPLSASAIDAALVALDRGHRQVASQRAIPLETNSTTRPATPVRPRAVPTTSSSTSSREDAEHDDSKQSAAQDLGLLEWLAEEAG